MREKKLCTITAKLEMKFLNRVSQIDLYKTTELLILKTDTQAQEENFENEHGKKLRSETTITHIHIRAILFRSFFFLYN